MADTNQGVVYTGPGSVEVQDLDYPKLELPEQNNRPLQHGVILKVVATNICGSDQHMARVANMATLLDIFPPGSHAAVSSGVTAGSTVYVAGAGPGGLACAAS